MQPARNRRGAGVPTGGSWASSSCRFVKQRACRSAPPAYGRGKTSTPDILPQVVAVFQGEEVGQFVVGGAVSLVLVKSLRHSDRRPAKSNAKGSGPCFALQCGQPVLKTSFPTAFQRLDFRDGGLGVSMPGNQIERRAVGWVLQNERFLTPEWQPTKVRGREGLWRSWKTSNFRSWINPGGKYVRMVTCNTNRRETFWRKAVRMHFGITAGWTRPAEVVFWRLEWSPRPLHGCPSRVLADSRGTTSCWRDERGHCRCTRKSGPACRGKEDC